MLHDTGSTTDCCFLHAQVKSLVVPLTIDTGVAHASDNQTDSVIYRASDITAKL